MVGMGTQGDALRMGGYECLLLNVVANPCGLTLADLIYTQHTHTNISLNTAASVCSQTCC